jgi:uncharacterized membrane protein YcaP (DUF421 family)
MMAIREHGLADVKDAYLAILETDGSISVIPTDQKPRYKTRKGVFKKR